MLSRNELTLLTSRGLDREDYKQLRTVQALPKQRRDRGGLCNHDSRGRPKGPARPDIVIKIGRNLLEGRSIKTICMELGVNRKLVYRWGKRLKIGRYAA